MKLLKCTLCELMLLISITVSAVNPTTPAYPTPSDGETDVPVSGTFSWKTSAGDGGSTLNYDLYLGTSSSNMSLYKKGQNSKSCSYSGLEYGKKYYWKVIVYNGSGGSAQSEKWSFTTKS
ncbi:MAG: fibronectin type III domain-containing protein, partial [Prevotella sp.]|nr:fibronectin type III domain-containing protein [Prevotella sp.]